MSFNTCTVSLQPVQPNGWPNAMAPPFILTISGFKPSSLYYSEGLRGKSFVEFYQVNIVQA